MGWIEIEWESVVELGDGGMRGYALDELGNGNGNGLYAPRKKLTRQKDQGTRERENMQ